MNIKTPVAYDTSYWESIPDFAKVNPRPLYVATRATLGKDYTDPTFVRYFTDLGFDGIRRGAYHAFRKAQDAKEQARKFISVVKPFVTNKDVLEFDFEEGGETAAQLLTWLEVVHSQFPANLIMVYSRRNLMDQIVMTAAQKLEMKRYPVWVAGYPPDPDIYNEVPDFYIPDPTRWGPVYMWQYSDQAIVEGVKGEVDVNWLSPDFIKWLGTQQGVLMYYGKVTTDKLNIRSGPGTAYADIGDLFKGDLVEASELVGGWWHLTKATRANGTPIGWNGEAWSSGTYIAAYVPPTPPAPEPTPDVDWIVAHFVDGSTKKYVPE